MRTTFFMMLCFLALSAKAQDTVQDGRTQVFSFTPFSRNVSQVNGLALGIGNNMRYLWNDESRRVTTNGINLEINPVGTLAVFFIDPEKMNDGVVQSVNNGLHLSTAGFTGNAIQNGVAVALYNIGIANNGISVIGTVNYCNEINGLHIAGILNQAEKGIGLHIAPFNYADTFTGIQLGGYNKGGTITGLQVGIFNRAETTRGLQLGLWNKNGRRSLPIINW